MFNQKLLWGSIGPAALSLSLLFAFRSDNRPTPTDTAIKQFNVQVAEMPKVPVPSDGGSGGGSAGDDNATTSMSYAVSDGNSLVTFNVLPPDQAYQPFFIRSKDGSIHPNPRAVKAVRHQLDWLTHLPDDPRSAARQLFLAETAIK